MNTIKTLLILHLVRRIRALPHAPYSLATVRPCKSTSSPVDMASGSCPKHNCILALISTDADMPLSSFPTQVQVAALRGHPSAHVPRLTLICQHTTTQQAEPPKAGSSSSAPDHLHTPLDISDLPTSRPPQTNQTHKPSSSQVFSKQRNPFTRSFYNCQTPSLLIQYYIYSKIPQNPQTLKALKFPPHPPRPLPRFSIP